MTVVPLPAQPGSDRPAHGCLTRLRDVAGSSPERIAFRLKVADGYREVSYGDARARVERLARGLATLGIEAGDRVAIISENRLEWAIAYLAILAAGAVVVPLDPQLSRGEWRRLLDDSESKAVFASGLHHAAVVEALQGAALATRIIAFDPLEGSGLGLGEVEARGAVGPAGNLPERPLDEVAVIIYTSGTTGNPKGVMLTHANIASEIEAVLRVVHADHRDVFLCLLPLQHVFASVTSFLLPVWIGAQVVFADTLKRAEILRALGESGITVLATVPQFFYLFHTRIEEELRRRPAVLRRLFGWLRLLNRATRRRGGASLGRLLFRGVHAAFGARLRLFVSGGSAFDPKVAQEFHDLGFTILQGYGLTETTGGCTVTRPEDNVIGSVGRPIPGVALRIIAPDAVGVGEIAISGPVLMKGYYRNPAATAEVVRDGWFLSGDLGRLDARGNLFITGRKKEVVVLPNGKNIYPDEVEAHYQQSPFIQEIAVVGVSEGGMQHGGERLHGVIVPDFDALKARRIANAREFVRDEIARLSAELPRYKRLMSYEVQRDPLPRTTTRKIKRLELKRRIEAGASPGAPAAPAAAETAEDAALRGSPVGREVIRAITEAHGRGGAVELGMNLELDLGFDSMERVELMAALEQSLGLALDDAAGAEVHTVRELITRLERESRGVQCGAGPIRQSWRGILSEEAVAEAAGWVRFSGPGLSFLKWLVLRPWRLAFGLLLRLEVRGIANLPAQPPFLICPNHQSFLDPFVVMSVLPWRVFRRVFFVGYSEFFRHPIMKLLARLANIVPVDPDAQLLRAMKVGAHGLRRGRVLCIFPEGGRTVDGALMEFRKGAAILAAEVNAPMVPVGLTGLHQVWPRGSRRIRLHPAGVVFGRPLEPTPGEPASYDQDTARLQAAVAALVEGR